MDIISKMSEGGSMLSKKSRNTLICKSIWFSRETTESPVYDILQLKVLHTGRLMIQLAGYSRYRTPFQCLTATQSEGSTRAVILPGRASLDRGSREAEFGFDPRTLRGITTILAEMAQVVRARIY
ncbi:hypothetical protein T265_12985, partial [Opisthorchis viverrini]